MDRYMLVTLKKFIFPKIRQFLRNHSENVRHSYSQSGEDLILQQLFTILDITKITYLDVGAHHPTYLSNTFLFYINGGSGVCVEPDPSLFKLFGEKRPRDTHLNCGAGTTSGEADFFLISTSTLNTFSKEDAERHQSSNKFWITNTIKIRIETINNILEKNFEKVPHLVSLDVEGMDYLILKNFDFNKYRPKVFCLETLSFSEDKSERKLTEIIELMHANGYITYADTYINTIFVDSAAWNLRP